MEGSQEVLLHLINWTTGKCASLVSQARRFLGKELNYHREDTRWSMGERIACFHLVMFLCSEASTQNVRLGPVVAS
jgi:hypothetical protein